MIIELRKNFSKVDNNDKEKYAKEKNGILYIGKKASVRKVMYDLTYAIKGKRRCYYCGRKIPKNKMSLDHQYPQELGGPTIPNNLVPSCTNCNNHKANMNAEQYKIYQTLGQNEKSLFISKVMRQHEEKRKNIGFDLPEEWISKVNLDSIKLIDKHMEKGKKYYKIKEHYEKYSNFPYIVMLDRNLKLLSGYNVYIFAKEKGITEILAIILENVELK